MLSDATHVLRHARFVVLDRLPLDEVAGRVPAVVMRIGPLLSIEGRRPEVVIEEIAHDLVGERLNPAIGVMNDEPFSGAEKLV